MVGFILRFAGIFWLGFLASLHAYGEVQKKPLSDIDIDQFTSELQVVVSDASSMTQVWWIPAEFWASAFTRTNPALAEQAMSALSDYGILAVVQADITPLASFVFHDREDVAKRMSVRFSSYARETVQLEQASELPDSVQMLINVLGPMFANTMGELGKNMHLYVMDNTDKNGIIIDPYKQGRVTVNLAATKTTPERHLSIDLPVDALYEPRYCPNGKPAHISWNYCPWSGKKL
ncbi:MAG: hypothetical protein R3208_00025 [Ketobacteraceae bacterium]|nr:hypothetical protein [Ketobacteraceae bacterium]